MSLLICAEPSLLADAISKSSTMACPSVRGDNPRALASGLSYVQGDKHDITILYTTYISVDLAHQVIFHAKVGKGGISIEILCTGPTILNVADSFQTTTVKIAPRHISCLLDVTM